MFALSAINYLFLIRNVCAVPAGKPIPNYIIIPSKNYVQSYINFIKIYQIAQ